MRNNYSLWREERRQRVGNTNMGKTLYEETRNLIREAASSQRQLQESQCQ